MPDNNVLLEIKGLKTYFFLDEGIVKAVDGVDLTIKRGITLGVVGESGCGKSVTAFSILQLVEKPGRIVDGQILLQCQLNRSGSGSQMFETVDITAFSSRSRELRSVRGNEIAMIFQGAMNAMNPVLKAGEQIDEVLKIHLKMPRKARRERVDALMEMVEMDPKTAFDYPHQLSGGMKQRVMIAMALACNPAVLVADEPTSNLDVTIQAQILSLLEELKKRYHSSILFITHDLGVVSEVSDKVIVLYAGTVVEFAEVRELFKHPLHPYTRALLHSVPSLGSRRRLESIGGNVPNLVNPPSGCRFHPRCPHVMDICRKRKPDLYRDMQSSDNVHLAACFLLKPKGAD